MNEVGYDPDSPTFMDIQRQRQTTGFSNRLFSLVGIVGLFAVVIAGATVWLLLTDPVTVAESIDSGEVSPLVESLAGSIYDAIVKLLKYL
jgi:hypothetical protein